jgi:hypothetical protein
VAIGVTALMIAANALVTWVWAYEKSTKGIELIMIPAIVRCFQALKVFGSLVLKIRITTSIARAPKAVLPKATPTGVKKVRESSINKKEAPQIKPAIEYIATQGFLVVLVISLP